MERLLSFRVRSAGSVKYIFLCVLLISNAIGLWSQILDKSIAVVSLYKTENVSLKTVDMQYDLLQRQAENLTGIAETSITKKEVLEAAINDILITQEANKSGVVVTAKQIDDIIQFQKEAYGTPISDEDFQSLMVKQTGLQWPDYREQIRKRILQEQYIATKYQKDLQVVREPTEAEIQKLYDEYATRFINPSMLRSEHLFWDFRGLNAAERKTLKQEAQKMAQTIDNDVAVFDKELKKSLENPAIEGGDLGYIIRDEQTKEILGASFLDIVFALKDNQVSDLVTSNSGYHIVKITDKRPAKLLGLEDPILPGEKVTVKQRIITTLQTQYRQEKFADLIQKEVEELRKRASVRILDDQFK